MISCQPKLLSIHLLVALDLKAGRNILQKAECRLLQATEGEVFKTDDTGKDTRLSVVTRHHSHIKELALVPVWQKSYHSLGANASMRLDATIIFSMRAQYLRHVEG